METMARINKFFNFNKSFLQSKTEYKKEIEDNLNMEYSQKIKALNYKKQQLEEREKRLVILDNHRVEVGKKLKELENVKKQLTELEKKNEKVDFENQAYQMQLCILSSLLPTIIIQSRQSYASNSANVFLSYSPKM